MSFSSWRQRIKYRLKAKSRHGIHSPFVYDFIEQVLLRGHGEEKASLLPACLNEKQQFLVQAIADHYRIAELVWENTRLTLDESGAGVLYLAALPGGLPAQYAENDIAVIPDIYKNDEQAGVWRKLMESNAVPLSLDVFEMGILFFRKDFKVKQHFILKYR